MNTWSDCRKKHRCVLAVSAVTLFGSRFDLGRLHYVSPPTVRPSVHRLIPRSPVAKSMKKAIGSPSLFVVSFMKSADHRFRLQFTCFHLSFRSGYQAHMPVWKSLGGSHLRSSHFGYV
jgi:hypothetical protein